MTNRTSRRRLLKQASLATFGVGFFGRIDQVAAMQPAARPGTLAAALQSQAAGASETLLLKGTPGEEGPPPYLALGDHTVLKRGMCFSEEPGLFDPDTGCGFNWSDTVVVGQKSGYRMSRVPYSKAWCFITV